MKTISILTLLGGASARLQMLIGTNGLGTTPAVLTQCADDFNAFQLDIAATSINPNPLVKGEAVNFEIKGIVTEAITVKNFHVHVDWN